jgi:hypothetical protein
MENAPIVVNPKSSFNTPPKTDFHFFAASFYDWGLTTPTRTLPELIDLMNKFGNNYDLWWVPLPHDETYSIDWYAPQVDGAVKVGTFKPKSNKNSWPGARKKKAA